MSEQDSHLMVRVNAMGDVHIEAINCTGDQCVQASEPLEVVLGGVDPGDRTKKPEFYAPADAATGIQSQF